MKTNQRLESKKGYINKYPPVDCNNDVVMVTLGLRIPLVITHPELHTKTPYEKEELKRLKSSCIPISRTSAIIKEPHELVEGVLTVYLKNTEKSNTFRTTKTFKCYKNEVNNILEEFKNDRLVVNKHYFKY